MFDPPPIFKLIQKNSGSSNREMFEVFNMGCRLEIYCDEKDAASIIELSKSFSIEAQIIGRVESDVKKSVEIHFAEEVIVY
jgi:phosphoribosylformylglycinamidine cyclo-ligase